MAATASSGVRGGAIGNTLHTVTETETRAVSVQLDASDGAILMVEIDNTGNSQVVYLNLYDADSATLGTTVEDWVFPAAAGARTTYSCPKGCKYDAGLTAGIVQTPGTDVGPSASVTAYVLVET